MNLECWIYATRQGCETPESAVSVVRRLGPRFRSWLDAGLIAGYQAVALTDPEELVERDLDPEILDPVTHGELPAIYLNLTYELGGPRPDAAERDALLAEAGLVHVFTDSSAGQ
ncbi:hypothetical protein [Actinoplanes sp. NBRC 103695]|uniref:hypothetical protein n=1 Tax=Actinoplanes sp. NBRC 103695 TaxID=3032202 RepID=UPI0024A347E0|nr:hypothetical protein [Actinoplanes sp. NBRC 103695]GLZ02379.1 hypothetical protein Acsp02_96300 [Actinoplanes sp. NBRC 103695]